MSVTETQSAQDPVPEPQATKTMENEPTKTEQKEIDAPEDEEMMIANAMSGDKIKELLSAEGPTVKSVLLKTDGSIEEILYDSTPSKNHVTEILGAPPSIIGQYPDLDVIVVGPRCEKTKEEFELNKHKLRYPFNNDTFHGDIFLYRFDQNCVMQHFTVEEYKAFAAKSDEDIGKVFKPMINDEQDTLDEEEEDEYDEEEAAQATQDFMREIIVNKVRAEFPAKFGREPTEEELQSYISGIMQAAGGLFGVEVNDDDDADYEPEEEEEENEEMPNDEELEQDKKDIQCAHNEEAAPLKEMDENELIHSEAFEQELLSAMECVQHMAKVDREKILSLAKEEYAKDIGHEPTEEMMTAALQMFATGDDDERAADECDCDKEVKEEPIAEQEEEEIDPKLFETEMHEALQVIRNLGKQHQQELVGKICDTFTELNGSEPTQEQLADIFGRIKGELAEEAKDEFLDQHDSEEDDAQNDPDYEPNSQDIQQVEDDKKMEVLEELMEDLKVDESENQKKAKKIKILVTPVKRRPSGSKMAVYLNEPDTKKTLEAAENRFEQINHRAPSEEDSQRLKEFCDTGMLFESVIKPDIDFDDDQDEDEEYDPTKDTFDYSQDIEDDKAFEAEQAKQEFNENEDTSNMIDID